MVSYTQFLRSPFLVSPTPVRQPPSTPSQLLDYHRTITQPSQPTPSSPTPTQGPTRSSSRTRRSSTSTSQPSTPTQTTSQPSTPTPTQEIKKPTPTQTTSQPSTPTPTPTQTTYIQREQWKSPTPTPTQQTRTAEVQMSYIGAGSGFQRQRLIQKDEKGQIMRIQEMYKLPEDTVRKPTWKKVTYYDRPKEEVPKQIQLDIDKSQKDMISSVPEQYTLDPKRPFTDFGGQRSIAWKGHYNFLKDQIKEGRELYREMYPSTITSLDIQPKTEWKPTHTSRILTTATLGLYGKGLFDKIGKTQRGLQTAEIAGIRGDTIFNRYKASITGTLSTGLSIVGTQKKTEDLVKKISFGAGIGAVSAIAPPIKPVLLGIGVGWMASKVPDIQEEYWALGSEPVRFREKFASDVAGIGAVTFGAKAGHGIVTQTKIKILNYRPKKLNLNIEQDIQEKYGTYKWEKPRKVLIDRADLSPETHIQWDGNKYVAIKTQPKTDYTIGRFKPIDSTQKTYFDQAKDWQTQLTPKSEPIGKERALTGKVLMVEYDPLSQLGSQYKPSFKWADKSQLKFSQKYDPLTPSQKLVMRTPYQWSDQPIRPTQQTNLINFISKPKLEVDSNIYKTESNIFSIFKSKKGGARVINIREIGGFFNLNLPDISTKFKGKSPFKNTRVDIDYSTKKGFLYFLPIFEPKFKPDTDINIKTRPNIGQELFNDLTPDTDLIRDTYTKYFIIDNKDKIIKDIRPDVKPSEDEDTPVRFHFKSSQKIRTTPDQITITEQNLPEPIKPPIKTFKPPKPPKKPPKKSPDPDKPVPFGFPSFKFPLFARPKQQTFAGFDVFLKKGSRIQRVTTKYSLPQVSAVYFGAGLSRKFRSNFMIAPSLKPLKTKPIRRGRIDDFKFRMKGLIIEGTKIKEPSKKIKYF